MREKEYIVCKYAKEEQRRKRSKSELEFETKYINEKNRTDEERRTRNKK